MYVYISIYIYIYHGPVAPEYTSNDYCSEHASKVRVNNTCNHYYMYTIISVIAASSLAIGAPPRARTSVHFLYISIM